MPESVRRDEVETITCCVRPECSNCRGSGRKPLKGTAYLWADGFWRKDRPPSEDNIVFKVRERYNDGVRDAKPAPLQRKPVPKSFKSTPRTALRCQALSLAISAAPVIHRHGTVDGPTILKDAEAIERWIADTPMEKPK